MTILVKVDPYKRVQNHLRMTDLFPIRKDGFCACGCGKKLTGRRTRWASQECSSNALYEYWLAREEPEMLKNVIAPDQRYELLKHALGNIEKQAAAIRMEIQGIQDQAKQRTKDSDEVDLEF